jgi:hypothetical protein
VKYCRLTARMNVVSEGLPKAACANETKFLSDDNRRVAFAAACGCGMDVNQSNSVVVF